MGPHQSDLLETRPCGGALPALSAPLLLPVIAVVVLDAHSRFLALLEAFVLAITSVLILNDARRLCHLLEVRVLRDRNNFKVNFKAVKFTKVFLKRE
jgi:hypothetical protein